MMCVQGLLELLLVCEVVTLGACSISEDCSVLEASAGLDISGIGGQKTGRGIPIFQIGSRLVGVDQGDLNHAFK